MNDNKLIDLIRDFNPRKLFQHIFNYLYITNIKHFLDENGNIAAEMNDSGRKMASFLAMIIDHSTAQQEEEMTDNIRLAPEWIRKIMRETLTNI